MSLNPSAYYNEFEPYAAAWLRNLITAGLIADGEVDERSIVDVRPGDLRGFNQCHFFAGIGVWSHALRLAGWPDDRPVWTGSCPCQPFSAAGKGKGTADERHLWPEFHRLIAECKPPVVFGEQVASKDGLGWLDAVHADMEGTGYALGAADLGAAGLGAPHIRQRLWFVGERLGHHHHQGLEGQRSGHQAEGGWIGAVRPVAEAGELGGMANSQHDDRRSDEPGRGSQGRAADGRDGATGLLAHTSPGGRGEQRHALVEGRGGYPDGGGEHHRPGPVNGHWRDADWLFCRDGRWRPVEPGTFPLVDGSAFKLGSGSTLEGRSRVGMLRAYGNAIVASVAQEFISAFMEARP